MQLLFNVLELKTANLALRSVEGWSCRDGLTSDKKLQKLDSLELFDLENVNVCT